MKIQEIQRTPSEGPVDKTDEPSTMAKLPAGVKPVPGAPNLGYQLDGGSGQMQTMFTGASHKLWLYDLEQKAPIGWLALRDTAFPLPRSMQVANAQIRDAYRGRGLGQSLYGVAIKVLGMTIVADETQTPEARRLWTNLHGIPGVSIRGWINFMAEDVFTKFDKFNMNNTRANQRRIASLQRLQTPRPMNQPRDQFDYVYFDFPVQSGPGGQELQAAEKFAAIYTRYHPEDNPRTYDVGLYARWTGQ